MSDGHQAPNHPPAEPPTASPRLHPSGLLRSTLRSHPSLFSLTLNVSGNTINSPLEIGPKPNPSHRCQLLPRGLSHHELSPGLRQWPPVRTPCCHSSPRPPKPVPNTGVRQSLKILSQTMSLLCSKPSRGWLPVSLKVKVF